MIFISSLSQSRDNDNKVSVVCVLWITEAPVQYRLLSTQQEYKWFTLPTKNGSLNGKMRKKKNYTCIDTPRSYFPHLGLCFLHTFCQVPNSSMSPVTIISQLLLINVRTQFSFLSLTGVTHAVFPTSEVVSVTCLMTGFIFSCVLSTCSSLSVF